EGEFDALCQRINPETKQAEDWQPPQPTPSHEWDGEAKRWRLNEALVAKREARTKALERIAALEQQQLRPLREQALGMPGALERLREIDHQIAALRAYVRPCHL
ncbi:MAG: hypothetical protein ACYDAE_14505, partial [Steroidobacteraceae bacterium]